MVGKHYFLKEIYIVGLNQESLQSVESRSVFGVKTGYTWALITYIIFICSQGYFFENGLAILVSTWHPLDPIRIFSSGRSRKSTWRLKRIPWKVTSSSFLKPTWKDWVGVRTFDSTWVQLQFQTYAVENVLLKTKTYTLSIIIIILSFLNPKLFHPVLHQGKRLLVSSAIAIQGLLTRGLLGICWGDVGPKMFSIQEMRNHFNDFAKKYLYLKT